MIHSARNVVDMVLDEEQDALDNMPESFEGSEQYEKIENAIDLLNDTLGSIDGALDSIEEITG